LSFVLFILSLSLLLSLHGEESSGVVRVIDEKDNGMENIVRDDEENGVYELMFLIKKKILKIHRETVSDVEVNKCTEGISERNVVVMKNFNF